MSVDGIGGEHMYEGPEPLPAQLWSGNSATGVVELRIAGQRLVTRKDGLMLSHEDEGANAARPGQVATGRAAVELVEQFLRRNCSQMLTIVIDQGTRSGSVEFHSPGNWPVIGVMLTPPYGPTLLDYQAGRAGTDG